MLDLAVTIGLGFVLGFLIGLTGVGGGALVAPALYIILGLSYAHAIGMSLIYSVFTKIVGVVQHVRLGNVDWRLTMVYSLAAIPGAVVGSAALYAARGWERVFPLLLGGLLVVIALLLLAEAGIASLAARERPFDPARISVAGYVGLSVLSFLVGVILGVTSVGSGSIVILSMVFLFRMPARIIVGSNIAIALIMVIPAGLTHLIVGGVDWWRLLLLMIGSVLGTALGSRGTTILPDRSLKLTIAVIVLVSAVATIIKAL